MRATEEAQEIWRDEKEARKERRRARRRKSSANSGETLDEEEITQDTKEPSTRTLKRTEVKHAHKETTQESDTAHGERCVEGEGLGATEEELIEKELGEDEIINSDEDPQSSHNVGVPLADIAPALQKIVTPSSEIRRLATQASESSSDSESKKRRETFSRKAKKSSKRKDSKREEKSRKSKGKNARSGSRLGCCARLLLSLSALLSGMFFVVGPITFLAGVRSGQVDRTLLETLGVAPWLEDIGVLPPKPPPMEPKFGFLSSFLSSYAPDLDAYQRRQQLLQQQQMQQQQLWMQQQQELQQRQYEQYQQYQRQQQQQQPLQDHQGIPPGSFASYASAGGMAAPAGTTAQPVEPNALALAQDWIVGAIKSAQTRLQESLNGEPVMSQATKQPLGTTEDSSDLPLMPDAGEAEEQGITVEQIQEELSALWSAQRQMFSAFRERLSKVSMANIFEDLSQHRAEPVDEEANGAQRSQGSHMEAQSQHHHQNMNHPHEIRTALEKQRAAEEMGKLSVKSSGPVEGVQRMLNGEGLPYDPEVPWTSI